MVDHVGQGKGRDSPPYPVREDSGPEVYEFFTVHGTQAVGRIYVIPHNWVARDILSRVTVAQFGEHSDGPRPMVPQGVWQTIKGHFHSFIKDYPEVNNNGKYPYESGALPRH